MGQRFKNDVVKIKCADGAVREAIITKTNKDKTYDVAYIKSYGCQNVEVFQEQNKPKNSIKGPTLQKTTILPYKLGDLVEYHLDEDVYYLAHITEIGKYNTVTVLLGDVYMHGWVKDDKRGDYVEASVEDIKWIGENSNRSDKELKRYGYEPKELRELREQKQDSAKKTASNSGKEKKEVGQNLGLVIAIVSILLFGGILYHYGVDEEKSSVEDEYIELEEIMEGLGDDGSYVQPEIKAVGGPPLERFIGTAYGKYYEDVTEEEKYAIKTLKIRSDSDDYDGGTVYNYDCYYTVNDSEECYISMTCSQSLDSYTFSELQGLSTLEIDCEDLKNAEFIAEMPNLQELSIEDSPIKDASALADSHIQRLSLDFDKELEDFSFLNGMTELEELGVFCYSDSLNGVDTNLDNLKVLYLDGVNDYSYLQYMPNVESLFLGYHSVMVSELDPQAISGLSQLKDIHIRKYDGYRQNLISIFNMSSLEEIEITEGMIQLDISSIKTNENLKKLTLSDVDLLTNVKMSGDGFITYVDYDEITLGKNMYILSNYPNLEELKLNKCEIEDTSEIAKLSKLKKLDLEDNYVKDVSDFTNLKELKELNLKNNSLSGKVDKGKFSSDVNIEY